ncbi:hypothetical protein FA10DRAFT_263558 [Acaromyces ingoldii]|uniref:VWFA domain-containing protein n=1 Tax=Acaromyces ingoldii TaxID=215250 RepID=A0A316YVL1_9BASI|nr:hypothetical protein FA10DRAFT_263558 [Acaromyces ingoldii]PWN92804.1 hypothetical protein FA10DRAFT_263558 [Acaromyces ingoldii]
MSSRRQPNSRNPAANADPTAGLPPPPPYQPVADPNTRAPSHAQQYAPPPGPPPGHQQPQPASNNPFADPRTSYMPQSGTAPLPRPPQNILHADPASYISSAAGAASSPPSSNASGVRRQDSVSAHARRLSQEMATSASSSLAAGSARQPSIKENQLEFLRDFDTIFIVDDSSSMNVNERPDGSMGQSRWEEARDALAGMVELAAKYDDDGLDIHFLNSEKSLLDCTSPVAVKQLFDSIQPEGMTPMGTKIEMLLLEYMDEIERYKATKSGKEPKKRNYVCITDGAATDDPESVIVACARRLDEGRFPLAQIGIQFVQVGNDAEAKEALEELDDALVSQHHIRDIVDTVPYQGMALDPSLLIKALLGGINRRLDRKKAP